MIARSSTVQDLSRSIITVIIYAEQVYDVVSKNCIFWNGGRPIGSGVDKNDSKWLKILRFYALAKFRGQICQMSERKTKIAAKPDGMAQE